jgi:hypothetical protein
MKATLEFNLPEEQTEHMQAVLAHQAWDALEDIARTIRMNNKSDISADVTLSMVQQNIRDIYEVIGNIG